MNQTNSLTPGHWIVIATIAVVVLGGVISVALRDHNARARERRNDNKHHR